MLGLVLSTLNRKTVRCPHGHSLRVLMDVIPLFWGFCGFCALNHLTWSSLGNEHWCSPYFQIDLGYSCGWWSSGIQCCWRSWPKVSSPVRVLVQRSWTTRSPLQRHYLVKLYFMAISQSSVQNLGFPNMVGLSILDCPCGTYISPFVVSSFSHWWMLLI